MILGREKRKRKRKIIAKRREGIIRNFFFHYVSPTNEINQTIGHVVTQQAGAQEDQPRKQKRGKKKNICFKFGTVKKETERRGMATEKPRQKKFLGGKVVLELWIVSFFVYGISGNVAPPRLCTRLTVWHSTRSNSAETSVAKVEKKRKRQFKTNDNDKSLRCIIHMCSIFVPMRGKLDLQNLFTQAASKY